MQEYVGFKKVKATPLTRGRYNEYRGWTLPPGENGADEGYLVEYVDGGSPNHPDHQGYISWSPKAVFEQAYKQVAHNRADVNSLFQQLEQLNG